MELIIRFVAMAVNGEPVGVLFVASSSSTGPHLMSSPKPKEKLGPGRKKGAPPEPPFDNGTSSVGYGAVGLSKKEPEQGFIYLRCSGSL